MTIHECGKKPENFYAIRISGFEEIPIRAADRQAALEKYANRLGITYESALRGLISQKASLTERLPHLPNSWRGVNMLELASMHIANREYADTDPESLRSEYKINPHFQPSQVKASISQHLMQLFSQSEGKLYDFLSGEPDNAMMDKLRESRISAATSFYISAEGLKHLVAYLLATQDAETNTTTIPHILGEEESRLEAMDPKDVEHIFYRFMGKKHARRGNNAA